MCPISILHLSDLHYGSSASFLDDNKAHAPDPLRDSTFRNLHLLLDECFVGTTFDAIAVSGDITTAGNVSGVEAFKAEAATRLRKLTRNDKAICLVPGNHDVQWELDSNRADYFDEKFKAYGSLVRALKATSSLVPTGSVPEKTNGKLSYADDIGEPLYIDQENQLLLLCLNSSMRCGEIDQHFINEIGSPVQQVLERLDAIIERRDKTVLK